MPQPATLTRAACCVCGGPAVAEVKPRPLPGELDPPWLPMCAGCGDAAYLGRLDPPRPPAPPCPSCGRSS